MGLRKTETWEDRHMVTPFAAQIMIWANLCSWTAIDDDAWRTRTGR